MLRLLTDEDFNGYVIGRLRKLMPQMDLVRVVDVMPGARDPEILEFAYRDRRVLVTHDSNTMPVHLKERQMQGRLMPGVIIVRDQQVIGPTLEQLLLWVQFDDPADFDPPLWL